MSAPSEAVTSCGIMNVLFFFCNTRIKSIIQQFYMSWAIIHGKGFDEDGIVTVYCICYSLFWWFSFLVYMAVRMMLSVLFIRSLFCIKQNASLSIIQIAFCTPVIYVQCVFRPPSFWQYWPVVFPLCLFVTVHADVTTVFACTCSSIARLFICSRVRDCGDFVDVQRGIWICNSVKGQKAAGPFLYNVLPVFLAKLPVED